MIKFAVSDVQTNTTKKLSATTIADSMQERFERPFEAAACNTPHLVESGSLHGFVRAAHLAFDQHHPLVLSPDDVWLCLAQGVAAHVNVHAEALRHRFVQHEGKVKLTVHRDDFVKGSPENDWPGMFAELSDKVAEHVGKKRDLFVADFSTTGAVERAASEIVLFDAMQQYFDYSLMTLCGIPEITLLGSVEDWISIRTRAAVFAEFEAGAWASVLLPVLDKIVQTARGKIDVTFWESFYKHRGGSGGPYITGWINVLFPYMEDQHWETNARTPVPNKYALNWEETLSREFHSGPPTNEFPSGLSMAPFVWNYLGTEIPMLFTAGFAGVSQDPITGAVRPAIGWAIGQK